FYEQRVESETDARRPPAVDQGDGGFAPLKMDLEFALLSFSGLSSAHEAFAAAQERSGADASWIREVRFVQRHDDAQLLADRLRIALPQFGSAIALIANAHDIDELLTATRESG